MAQSDDFKLIREIVAAGGHKKTVDELDRPKCQRLVELGWLKSSSPNGADTSYWVTERGKAAVLRF